MMWTISRWFRKKLGKPKLGVTHYVELKCPETDELLATEETEPVEVDKEVEGGTSVCTYDCDHCGGQHEYLWGPPAPILLDNE